MATVDVSVSSDLSPEKAWALASDLRRFDEWLTIFGGWKSEVPTEVEVGTCVSSTSPSTTPPLAPTSETFTGTVPVGGNDVHAFVVNLSNGQVTADLTGGLLNTRVGNLVAKVLESDVRKSVTNLAALR